MTSRLDDSSEVESESDYSNTSGALIFTDYCDGVRVERLIDAKALSSIPDSFPPFGCSVVTYDKSSESDSNWRRSYAVVKGRFIFLTRNESNQTPLRAFPLEQITFHMHNSNRRGGSDESDNFSADDDYSEFEIRLNGRRRSADDNDEVSSSSA
jgi:hypothetical protein